LYEELKGITMMLSLKQLLTIALVSRVGIFLVGAIAGAWIDDYDTSSDIPYRCPIVSSFSHWDSVYFSRIAQFGYEFENFYAFFPLFPTLERYASYVLQSLFHLAMDKCVIQWSGLLLSNACFMISVVFLYKLTRAIPSTASSSTLATLFYIFSPASIFLTAGYTESLFAATSLAGLYYHTKQRPIVALVCFCLACWTRSNGLLCAGFLVYAWLHRPRFLSAVFLVVQVLLLLFPSFLHQFHAFLSFCTSYDARPYCASLMGVNQVYPFIQSAYWGVGFMKYYRVEQIPNFLLAAPILILSLRALYVYVSEDWVRFVTVGLKGRKSVNNDRLCFYYYLFACVAAGLFVMHVQVTTRFLASNPALYWYLASKEVSESKRIRTMVLLYCCGYIAFGTLLFTNFYPWT
jgi:phosphatidylinositol glycan class V